MARPPRPLAAGLTYHVTARGNQRRAIFVDDRDRRRFVRVLDDVVADLGWRVGTFCLMSNHVHLLLQTPQPDLSAGMRTLLGGHARAFNDRHEGSGHLFGGRFHTRLVVRDAHHLELFRYLALNPVRAGLCRQPEDFRWSAHAALLGHVPAPRLLDLALAPFEGDRGRYERFVAAAGPQYLTDLLGDGSTERLHVAVDAGFTVREIGAALGTPKSSVARRLRRDRGA